VEINNRFSRRRKMIPIQNTRKLFYLFLALVCVSAFNILGYPDEVKGISDLRPTKKTYNDVQADPDNYNEQTLSGMSVLLPYVANAYPIKEERFVVFEAFMRPT
jgi:hypothetical protein